MKKIIAVVPTYNSVEFVNDRVNQLLNFGFDQIVVCDDNSDDQTVSQLSHRYGDKIVIHSGDKNIGSAGNRNRAMKEISSSDYAFFIDCDCMMIYENLLKLIKDSFKKKDTGIVGFGILDTNNKPMVWNFGDLFQPKTNKNDIFWASLYYKKLIPSSFINHFAPNMKSSMRLKPAKNPVGWVAEGCFAIRSSLFIELNGFDSNMRYHEAQDLSIRANKNGYRTIFIEQPVAKHLRRHTGLIRYLTIIRKNSKYLINKHYI